MSGSSYADGRHAGKKTDVGKNCRKRSKKITAKKDSMLHAGTDVCKAAIQAAAMDAAGSIVLEADIKADKSSANRLLSKTPKCPKLVTESPPAYRRLHDHMADESKSGFKARARLAMSQK